MEPLVRSPVTSPPAIAGAASPSRSRSRYRGGAPPDAAAFPKPRVIPSASIKYTACLQLQQARAPRRSARLLANAGGGGRGEEGSPVSSSDADYQADGLPSLESDSQYMQTSKHGETGGSNSGGSRAGLFRTPISGGVHTATSVHDLPPPARAVRNLMEQARFAHLCTVMSRMHHRRAGYPFGSLVDFAPDPMGHPIFSLSPLAIHTRNLLEDPRCTVVVQVPGWSGLSNARVTIFGDVVPLPADLQEWAHQQYVSKHQQWASHQWGNFYYYKMQTISDIYFIGGFGTVAWLDVKEYEALKPDKIATDGGEQSLKELNAMYSKPLKKLLSTEGEVDDAALISIDSKGIDIRVRQGAQFNIQRIAFELHHSVETLEEAKEAIRRILGKSRWHAKF
uniref:CREG-like beta-barrel domain-containing protein n=1 Tax=Oryza punctata TaxID=4537 RepID=A0A0E0JVI5_ORYPU